MKFRKVYIPLAFMFVFNIFSNIVHPVTPAYLQSLHVGSYMFGVAFACMSATTFLSSPFWGKVSDQIGRTKVLAAGFLFYALGQLIFASAHTEFGIALARCVAGLGSGATGTALMAYITDCSLPEERSRNLVVAGAMSTVVSSFGFLVGGVLGDRIGIHAVFMLQVAVTMGLAILSFFSPEAHAVSALDWRAAARAADPGAVLKDCARFLKGPLGRFFLSCLLTNFAGICFDQCYNYYLRDMLGFPTSYNGYVKAAIGLLGLLANTLIGMRLTRGRRLQKGYFGIVLGCAVLSAAVVIPKTIPVFLAVSLSYYMVYSLEAPIQQAKLAGEDGDAGILFGVFQSFRSIGWIAGALAAGFLYGAGPKFPFLAAGAAAALALLFIRQPSAPDQKIKP